MSWVDRLQMLDLPCEQASATDTVYIDGSRSLVAKILKELLSENKWITISSINYDRLKQRYNNDMHKTLKYLLTQRTDTILYEDSHTNIKLRAHCELSYATQFVDVDSLNYDCLKLMYDECCDQITEYTMHKIVLIIDCRLGAQLTCDERRTLFLDIIMQLAMLSKRHMNPLLEPIIICDMCDGVPKTTSTALANKFIYDILLANYTKDDTLMPNFDGSYIKNVILENHRRIEYAYDLM